MTYYEVLSVTVSDNAEALRSAYLALARRMHPDRHSNSRESNVAFAEVTVAYETLTDSERRAKYEAGLALLTDECDRCGGSGIAPARGFKKVVVACMRCCGSGRTVR